VLLQHQRCKAVELAQRRAHREQVRTAFRGTLNWLLARAPGATVGRLFPRGFGGTVPRHT
jgi:hypothetical protein